MDLLKEEDDLINGGSISDHTAILFGCGMATELTQPKPSRSWGRRLSMANIRCIPRRCQGVPASNLSILQSCGLRLISLGKYECSFRIGVIRLSFLLKSESLFSVFEFKSKSLLFITGLSLIQTSLGFVE